MSEFVLPGTEVAVRTFNGYPGFTFHKTLAGYAYARNGRAQPGMHGNGTPRYTWTARKNGKRIASDVSLRYVKEVVGIYIETGEDQ